ncbi:MAG: hypothetical protein LBS84_00260, partial [Clostridiales bacterium]|nr:hypothetical protein [Clostridiales bacterium]
MKPRNVKWLCIAMSALITISLSACAGSSSGSQTTTQQPAASAEAPNEDAPVSEAPVADSKPYAGQTVRLISQSGQIS